eukprot:TRINITY_DN67926_c0_g1_i2.p1 TRINITY_DN67926_c0_g1~~TRINITY_DN67926_c0_g1_i2.p1  ORF type:complete len:447 (+),score=107.09 TRINITY_DN67926_c0_g1_i2:97-1437(+)
MEALWSLFEVVGGVNEVFERSQVKDEEVSTLTTIVQSIWQSISGFFEGKTQEERDQLYHSNMVWSQLMQQLQACHEVLAKHRKAAAQDAPMLQDSVAAEARPVASAVRRSLGQAQRTMREGMEALSGKLGAIGTAVLKLPEDELAIIKQASSELQRLVPLLQLAITTQQPSAAAGPRGTKRSLEDASPSSNGNGSANGSGVGVPQLSDGPALGGRSLSAESFQDLPAVKLELTSEGPAARGVELASLTLQDLRPGVSQSTTSLDSNAAGGDATSPGGSSSSARRFRCGRAELANRVPNTLSMSGPGGPRTARRPYGAFISRDLFVLEVPTLAPASLDVDAATLAFGGPDLTAATLAWGTPESYNMPAATPPPVGFVSGLTKGGLHVRRLNETAWKWSSESEQVELFEGDTIALLMESPPSSEQPAPQRTLADSEARLLLGMIVKVL